MTTARTICNRALRLIGVTQVGKDASNEDAVEALQHLNAMMLGLNARGAIVEWSELGMSGAVPLDEEMDDTLVYALGRRLITPMGASQPDPDMMQDMRKAERLLKARLLPIDRVRFDIAKGFSRNRRSM